MSAMNWPVALPFSPETAITVMAALAAFVIVWAVWSTFVVPDLMRIRAKRLRGRQEELRARMLSTRRQAQHKAAAVGVMRRVTQRLHLLKAKTGTKTLERLSQAGWRSKDALVVFLFMKLVLPFVFAAGAFFLFNVIRLVELNGTMAMLAPLAGLGLGAYAPEIFVRNAIGKRQKLMQEGLPDAIDLLVICAEAGLSLDAALTRVSGDRRRDRADRRRARLPAGTASGLGQPVEALPAAGGTRDRQHPAADGEVRNAARQRPAGACRRVPRGADAQGRGQGRPAAGVADRADDRIHHAVAVHRHHRAGGDRDPRQFHQPVAPAPPGAGRRPKGTGAAKGEHETRRGVGVSRGAGQDEARGKREARAWPRAGPGRTQGGPRAAHGIDRG
jgi:hypothetical protein